MGYFTYFNWSELQGEGHQYIDSKLEQLYRNGSEFDFDILISADDCKSIKKTLRLNKASDINNLTVTDVTDITP